MQKLVFSSDELPSHLDDYARFKLWRDMYVARYGEAEISYADNGVFHAKTELALFGQIGVVSMVGNLNRHVRTAKHVSTDPRGDLLIGFNRNPRSQIMEQRGKTLDFRPGEGQAIAYSNAEASSSNVGGSLDLIGLSISMKEVLQRLPNAEDLLPNSIAVSAASVHLSRYLDFVLDSKEIDGAPLLQEQIESTLLDLLVLALGAGGDSAELAAMRGLRAARVREIIAMIKAHFGDPGFSPHEVAYKLGMSARYVQNLLQETGLSFTERVLELRLQKARAMLADRRHDRLKVSDIAFSSGFGDVSYFNQAFRRRYGASPTQMRGGDG